MKQIFRFSLLLLALLLPATATAYDFEVDGICYKINGNEATVTSKGDYYDMFFVGYLGSVVIPATVTYNGNTYPVTSIDEIAFYYCTRLTSIDIPNSITKIGNFAFGCCPELANIVVESGNPRYDSRNNCNAIIETADNTLIVGCKNTIIPNSVTSIGGWAFSYCYGLTSITIPNSVTAIGNGAFEGCIGLTSVDISNSVTSIGRYAFYNCQGLTSINIPYSVTSIGNYAFFWCTGLTSIVIPNSVTSIGNEAFKNCWDLTDVYCYIADLSGVSCGNELFDKEFSSDYSGRTLHVMMRTADAYRADENWYPYFGRIVDDLMPVHGDVNGDLEVNIADVNAVINVILGGGNIPRADVNGDGEINIADVNAIINIILSGHPEWRRKLKHIKRAFFTLGLDFFQKSSISRQKY